MRVYETFEVRLNGPKPAGGWASVDVWAVFTNGERSVETKGFYDRDGVYCVRFLPEQEGTWSWKVSGVVSGEGSFTCYAAEEGRHGIVRTHFAYGDGTWFYPFGTTVYALLHQEEALIDQTMESLMKSPFNKVRLCVFPKHYNYNQNEPQFYPFEKNEDGSWDAGRPCIEYWKHFDRRIAQLGEMGIQADIILFHPYDRWGFSKLTREERFLYLDYLLCRISAYPNVWWSLANEYDLLLDRISIGEWYEIEEFVASHDCFHHLLSNHNCFKEWDFARERTTHVSIQTKRLFQIPEWRQTFGKPVVIDECCYEGNVEESWGNISGREMTNRFWRAFVSGGYCTHGETFLCGDDVLWWAKGGKLKGESPKRIWFLRELAEELPGPIEPMEGGIQKIAGQTDEGIRAALDAAEGELRVFIAAIARMSAEDRKLNGAVEHEWQGHCGEQAYLYFIL